MPFVRRLIEVEVQLASNPKTNQPGTFSESSSSAITLKGHRATVRIQNSGTPSGSRGQVAIWGMSQSLMNQLSTLGMVFSLIQRNTLTVRAGNEGGQMVPVYAGTIVQAYADYAAAPDVPFRFECQSGLAEAVMPAKPSSFPGPSVDVAFVMSGLARQMGQGFENAGVTTTLPSTYLPGSLKSQVEKLAADAGINYYFDPKGILAIWPKGGSRGGQAPVVTPGDGLIQYPSFTQMGIYFRMEFNPNVAYGGLVEIRSAVTTGAAQSRSADVSAVLPANGQWAVYKLDHSLDSLLPNGLWESSVYGYNPRYPQPLPRAV